MPNPEIPDPVRRLLSADNPYADAACDGPFREFTLAGRTGVNAVSLHISLSDGSVGIILPTLGTERGTITGFM